MSNGTSKSDGIHFFTSSASTSSSSPESPPTPQLKTARPSNATVLVPSTSRTRNVPPSPLSRIQPSVIADREPVAVPQTTGSAKLPATNQIIEDSPCFIHSHLDRHGSLQDWLVKNKSSHPQSSHGHSEPRQLNNVATSSRQHTHHTPHAHHPYLPPQNHRRHSLQPSHSPYQTPGSSRVTSPTKEGSTNGYDTDQSSMNGMGSAILDGDLIDEREEGGSLTRQLAETAQGVREMSKQLGRTRVRSRIQHVLIVTKARDNRLIQLTRELALYLMQKQPASSPDGVNRPVVDERNGDRGMVVYVDAQVRMSKRFDAAGIQRDYPHLFKPVFRRRSSSSASVNTLSTYPSERNVGDLPRRPQKDEGQLRYWTSELCSNSPHLFDFVVTLGGDGTVLFTSWLFQRIVPPVLPFALGSLGFLTNFDFAKYKETMDKVVDDGIRVNLRMRFTCTVYRAIAPEETTLVLGDGGRQRKAIKRPGGEILMSQVDRGGWEALERPTGPMLNPAAEGKDKEIMCFSTRPVEQFEVLNDLVVDRGPSPYVSLLELFGDEHHLTTVQADGLTVSTPTGSTAYSLSAGGSLVHPQIPALLITPICPHTLSFRPMLLPDSMELRICVPYNSRSTAWASFDGRGRVELKQGDHIKVTASKFPFPTVCADKASTDWFSSISRTLRWNEREKQKSFVVVEEDREPASSSPTSRHRETFDDVKAKTASQAVKENGVRKEQDGKEPADGDEKEEDDREDEAFDIDDKSGGEATPSAPQSQSPDHPKIPPKSLHAIANSHRSGVDSPDRFATPYEGPPPLSQRHLVEALAAADIQEKENEKGERDDIRSDGKHLRVDGSAHLIPRGRSTMSSPVEDGAKASRAGNNSPRPSSTTSPRSRRQECKAKAFAFFGQDDSASDQSDDPSE